MANDPFSVKAARTSLLASFALVLAALGPACVDEQFLGPDVEDDSGVSGGCKAGASRCQGNNIEICQKDSTGARDWSVQTYCTSYQTCQTLSSGPACVDVASCTDGKKNQDETDLDCGGAVCGACQDNKKCGKDADCVSKVCSNGVCLVCKAGSYSCLGNQVRVCKADQSGWDVVATCDATKQEACDASSQKCTVLPTTGAATPTGTYFLFSFFKTGSSDFKGGYDVDGYEDYLYVNRSTKLDVYKVSIADSDGDEKLEPNQHPDNKDETGPIEQRTLTFVKTYENVTLGSGSVSELFATKDRIYFLKTGSGGEDIYEFIFATGQTNLVFNGKFKISCIGYDEKAKQWYGGYNSSIRVIYSYWPKAGGWAAMFRYPDLAGSHLDGIEVVSDPKTGTPYVYVSDMTSDFLAQYYLDTASGKWVQKNVFQYKETNNQYVEGMGFGAFNHFWATSGSAIYEVGGGDLQKYVGGIK